MSESDALRSLILSIDSIVHGKQYHFEQDDGLWYLRETGEYVTFDKMIDDVVRSLYIFENQE